MMWVKFRIYTAHSTHVIEAWNSQYQDWRTPSENLQPVGIDLHEAFLTGLVNDSNLLTPLSYSKESSQLEAEQKCCTVTDCVHRKVSTADHRLFPSCKLWCSCCSSLYPGISGRRLQTSWCWSPWSEDMNDCYQVLVALFRVFWLASNLHRNSAASCLPKNSMQLLHENILAVSFESAKASEDLFIVGDGLGCWSCAFFLWSGLPCAAWRCASFYDLGYLAQRKLHIFLMLCGLSCTLSLWSGLPCASAVKHLGISGRSLQICLCCSPWSEVSVILHGQEVNFHPSYMALHSFELVDYQYTTSGNQKSGTSDLSSSQLVQQQSHDINAEPVRPCGFDRGESTFKEGLTVAFGQSKELLKTNDHLRAAESMSRSNVGCKLPCSNSDIIYSQWEGY